LFVFWYHSPNVLDIPHICNISRLRVLKIRHYFEKTLFYSIALYTGHDSHFF
jgi:hypothetical protein